MSQPADAASREGKAPEISIVLPVYNGERFLAEAIDSVLAQDFVDFELIAVDDCSNDATPQILADYARRDSRIRLLRNAVNRKLPGSLNAGFAEARGSWLTWTSDDNVLLPQMLQALADARIEHPEADILYADYRLIDAEGVPGRLVETGQPGDLLIDNRIGCCFLYRKAVDHRLGGYDDTQFGVEDYDFWLRARSAGFVFQRIARELYHYRQHGGSLTETHARQIHARVHARLSREIALLPPSPQRALARVRMVTRDPYAVRPGLLLGALRDSPFTVLRQWRDLAAWLRVMVGLRLRAAAGRS